NPVPCVNAGEGRKLFVHSKIDPLREAERFISEIDTADKDLIIILGFGFGYHCGLLLNKISSIVNVIAIEKDESLLKCAFESRDLADIFKHDNFYMLADPSETLLSDIFRGKSSRNVIFVTHRGSAQLYPDYYQNTVSIIKSYISTKDVNIATLARFEKTWGSNTSRNIGVISRSCGVNQFFDMFKGIPAIVVAAGPSLTYSLDFIRNNIGKAVVIAVDTSYKLLIDNGITPHFCLSVDPQLINARYYEGIGKTDTILVSDPTVHPSIFRYFKGRVSVTGIAFDMMKWIDDICGEKGELTHGGSVSTNAYDFARRIGASPVYMVGQDLSFTSGLAHAKGSYLDEQIHNRTYRFNNAQMYNRRQLASLPPVYLNGVRGMRVLTNQKMMIFQNWFEKRNDSSLINATYNGVFINGVKNIPSDKVSFDYPPVDLRSKIDELYNRFKDETDSGRLDRLKKRIDDMLSEIEGLIPVLEKASSYASDLSEMIESGRDKSDPGRMSFILKKLSESDKYIESMKKSKGLISFSIQRVIHTITEGYELNSGKDDNAAERSVYLYRGLLEGTLFNRKILGKMRLML
ncbi:MAG: hypothetical protein CVV49_15465, partial [Spirochaetae bacterium HGW-Spirochaetae-5]